MALTYLQTESLSIGYSSPLAEKLDLSLLEGNVVSLVGGNGIGKSTLMRTLCGELKPIVGEVYILDKKLRNIPRKELAKYISVVSTSSGLTGGLTVQEFVELGRQPYTGVFDMLKGADKEHCRTAMRDTGITYKAGSYIAELSDGERQKAMIARALAQDTPVMFLDEPFSFLDPAARLEIMDMLCSIAKEKRKAVLLTCHDVALSLRMASRIWLFSREGCIYDFTPETAIKSNKLESLYQSERVHFSKELGDYIISKE
ncbi:MAG: ABC transporter ATP-binding protein [Prevotella sp.]|nr:ABC transporter ATP-binding protein [Prevotella sp.]MCM1074721.1 ABC transporter ATP-binding protein [Ruminococcus sp.]